ncbi:serine hydrolase domain-containing protein [Shouchella clausii]
MIFNRWKIGMLAAIIAVLCIAPIKAYAADTPVSVEQLEQKLELLIPSAMEESHIPGAAVVVTWQDRVLFSQGYGYADLEQKIVMNPQQTILPLGSLTKTLTAAVAVQLAHQQALDLHTDIRSYMKDISLALYSDEPITLHHLLTHTAGLDKAIYGMTAKTPDKMVDLGVYLQGYLQNQPPVRKPGQRYAYSNTGLGLAAYLVEAASGLPYEEYVARSLFHPLNMPSAAINAQPSAATARSYQYDGNSFMQLPYSYINLPGAGGVSTTPEEWAHFMIALLNEGRYQGKQVLTADMVETMQARQYTEHPALEGIGYGLFRSRLPGGQLALWHNGDVDGFSAKMELLPAEQLGILVVTNAPSDNGSFHSQVVKLITDMLPDTPWRAPQTGTEELSKFGIVDDVSLETYKGTNTLALAPKRGWGKWFHWLGYRDFQVESGKEGLWISGPVPDGESADAKRWFQQVGDGLFQNEQSGEYVFFRRGDDRKLQLVFPQGVTIEQQTSGWQHPRLAFITYVVIGLFWMTSFIAFILHIVWNRIRKKPKSHRLAPAIWLSGLLSLYLVGQLLYGNSEAITHGYPIWFAWGFLSLPILALLPAYALVATAWRTAMVSAQDRIYKIFTAVAVMMLIISLIFLNYWNMLSIPPLF